jgi:hypothetical protein
LDIVSSSHCLALMAKTIDEVFAILNW